MGSAPQLAVARLQGAFEVLLRVHSPDPVRRMLNRGLAAIMLVCCSALILLLIIAVIAQRPWHHIITLLVVFGLYLPAWQLNRRGSLYGGVLFVLFCAIGSATGAEPSSYTSATPIVPSIFLVAIAAATLFIHPLAGLWAWVLQLAAIMVVLFVAGVPQERIVQFLLIGSVELGSVSSVLIVGALIFVRALRSSIAANEALQQLNAGLEQRVAVRTAELRDSNQALLEAKDAAEQARAAAEGANRAKSQFLANMSHELRSPLNIILGFAQVLGNSRAVPAAEHAQVGLIMRSGEHLLNLIDQVLDLARIEAGRSALDEQPCDLQRLLDDLEAMFAFKAQDRGLRLVVTRDPALPRQVRADALKLRQVLINLLSNAVKFTPTGSICLEVTSAPLGTSARTAADAQIQFRVIDSGPGIAQAELNRIFEPFSQGAAGRQKREGAGLGLALSRNFVQLMGGDLVVSSVRGQGSSFSFSLPLTIIAAAPALPSRRVIGLAPGQRRYRILIVDDDERNRQLLALLLGRLGFELREASDGQQAVDAWRAWQPDLLWMDLRMPLLDGNAALQQIKAEPTATKIIALTASGLDDERAALLAVGYDDYVRKPFAEQTILSVLQQQLQLRYVYAESSSDQAQLPQQIAQLRATHAPLLLSLAQAVRELDLDATQLAISAIADQAPTLAQALGSLADRFDYPQIAALVA